MPITASVYNNVDWESGNQSDDRYLCMDEADRMIDMGFEEDVRAIMSHFKVNLWGDSAYLSINDKPCYSLRPCLGRFRISPNNP
jgi:hypothetical protein